LNLPKPSKTLKRKLAKRAIERKKVGGGGRDVGLENKKRRRDMIDASKRKKVQESSEAI
jgi:ATP-dependent RNA helicase DDX52/ROK1